MRWNPNLVVILVSIFVISSVYGYQQKSDSSNEEAKVVVLPSSNTLQTVKNESPLLISTVNGYLYLVDRITGKVIWSAKEDPILQLTASQNPVLFPDPLDGSLYRISADVISRLPYTIPDLVHKAPMILGGEYLVLSGKKDVWFNYGLDNGKRLSSNGLHGYESHCPQHLRQNGTFYLGRTEYFLTLTDPITRNVKWNLTYATYASHSMINMEDYDVKHITSSEDGHILTVDKKSHELLWHIEFDSTVVGVYMVSGKGVLQTVPFKSMAQETVFKIRKRARSHGVADFDFEKKGPLESTLYIGQGVFGLYAVCSATHELNMIRKHPINFDLLLLDGPEGSLKPPSRLESLPGHYVPPPPPKRPPVVDARHRITDQSTNLVPIGNIEPPISRWSNIAVILLVIFVCIVGGALTAIILHIKGFTLRPRIEVENLTETADQQVGCNIDDVPLVPRPFAERPGWLQIGHIAFDPESVLGRGSNGTDVFRGLCDGRDVAVKRIILRDSRVFQETDLLKKSYEHPNVIKYFWQELTAEFSFIALELCNVTLKEYAEASQPYETFALEPLECLRQVMEGISYLHERNIIHRDLKPPNVLLRGSEKVSGSSAGLLLLAHRVVISDFGLCREIPAGGVDVSKSSAPTSGSQGWLAPEVVRLDVERVTSAIDIFASGCLFYYVLSRGQHPFGEDLYARQLKINRNEYNLVHVSMEQNCTAYGLISRMLDSDQEKRPSAADILVHPFFWSSKKRLNFISEVSDYVDKASAHDANVKTSLERIASCVFQRDWRRKITPDLRASLEKQRPYKGDSLAHLIRAIRNKKNHFLEFEPCMRRELFNDTMEGYLLFYTQRFPHLVLSLYDWGSENLSGEDALAEFYPQRRLACSPQLHKKGGMSWLERRKQRDEAKKLGPVRLEEKLEDDLVDGTVEPEDDSGTTDVVSETSTSGQIEVTLMTVLDKDVVQNGLEDVVVEGGEENLESKTRNRRPKKKKLRGKKKKKNPNQENDTDSVGSDVDCVELMNGRGMS